MQFVVEEAVIKRAAQVLEAILFVSNGTLMPRELQELFNKPELSELIPEGLKFSDLLPAIIAVLNHRLQESGSAIELRQVGGGYQLFTRAEFAPYVRQAVLVKENKKLSKTTLETLSIIAYRQPVPKSELEYIRGVSCDYAIQKLLERQLIEPSGRAEDLPGKPLLYRTTQFFMEHFGLNSLEDLPKLKELKTDDETVEEIYKTPL